MDAVSLLADAAAKRDEDALRSAVCEVKQDYSAAPLLALLLLEDWHDCHEDIVFELGLIGNPCVVDEIAKAASTAFTSLIQWGNQQEFQRKCAYALARIGTDESRAALEDMVGSADSYLREFGKEGLSHWPMPYSSR